MTSAPSAPADQRADAQLLADHVAGDPLAFEVLIARHKDRLWAVALRQTGNPETAADALQDALISAYRRAGSFRGESQVTTWLHRIVVNACLDAHRKTANRPTVPLPDDTDRIGSISDSADMIALRMDLAEALAQLPPDQRQAVGLVDVEGWSIEEAAQIVGVPPGTIKSRCFRGRARLAKSLAHLRNQDQASDVPSLPATAKERRQEAQQPSGEPDTTTEGVNGV